MVCTSVLLAVTYRMVGVEASPILITKELVSTPESIGGDTRTLAPTNMTWYSTTIVVDTVILPGNGTNNILVDTGRWDGSTKDMAVPTLVRMIVRTTTGGTILHLVIRTIPIR
mmetsp:Transcript_5097/g.7802  ORF Transcript_5097/g.7802 Transcript_5097/m.7802 type:complete len:113 (-) Transcript_5097:862-1200(-)